MNTAAERTPTHGPMYLRIADDLRIRIETGELAPGDPLPSLAQIAAEYGVSQGVARSAIGLLRGQALITTGQGRRPTVRGTRPLTMHSNTQHQAEKDRVLWSEERRAKSGSLEDATGISLHEVSFRADYSRVSADREVPDFPEGTPLLRREYETTDERGRRIAWSVSWLPIALIEANPDLLDSKNEPWPGGTQHQLHTVGVEIAVVKETVWAKAPTTVDIERWGMAAGEPLLMKLGTGFDHSDQPVTVGLAAYPAETSRLEFVTPLSRGQ